MNLIDTINSYGDLRKNVTAHKYRDSILTYKELVEMSDALAVYLIEEFGEDKTPVVVYGHKQHEMMICFLACAKSGHAYIPIDSSLPDERIRDIIESSAANIIFSIGQLKNSVENVRMIDKDKIGEIFSSYKGRRPDKSLMVKPHDTYYIIYTSGSTGRPKGVQITLSCLESFIKWGLQIGNLNIEKNYIFMNQAPFSFDLSVMDLYLSLYTGSTLFSIDKDMVANLRELFDYFKTSDISVWVSTPSFAEMCLADKSFGQELLPKLEFMLFCGEVLPNSCVRKLHERFASAKVINTYGPTEATVAVTSVDVTPEIVQMFEPLPVGYVKDDCSIFIVDVEGKTVPEGEKGEILIAGESVSIGYYRNQEMTEKVFSKVMIAGQEKRCYKTGDEGYLKDGLLHYSGRIDFQIKLSGYRIELEDIENNLRKIDFVEGAVVLPVSKNGKVQYLVAVVTLNRAIDDTEFKIGQTIRNELKKFLPEYMIPKKVVIRDSIPMTANGKINRKALTEEIK